MSTIINDRFSLSKTYILVLVAIFGLSACNDSGIDSNPDSDFADMKDNGNCVTTTSTPNSDGHYDLTAPTKIKMGLSQNCEMIVGQARTIEVSLLPDENLSAPADPSAVLQEQGVRWTSSDPSIMDVDQLGRVEAKRSGDVNITVSSRLNTGVTAQAHFTVVTNPTMSTTPSNERLSWQTPVQMPNTLQKFVDRYSIADAVTAPISASASSQLAAGNTVLENDFVKWELVMAPTVGSGKPYVLRTDKTIYKPEPYSKKYFDKYQYFMDNRYLPMDATISPTGFAKNPQKAKSNNGVIDHPIAIASDGSNGIWIKGNNGSLSHIYFENLDADTKAEMLSHITQNNIARRGQIMAGGVSRDPASTPAWTGGYSDSDPITTGFYAVGELMRWAVQQREGDDYTQARQNALASLKQMLALPNITGRQGSVEAKIRLPALNSDVYRPVSLKKERDFAVNINPFGPAGLTKIYGDIYNLEPIKADDWNSLDPNPFNYPGSSLYPQITDVATTKRMVEGLPVRYFSLNGAMFHGKPQGPSGTWQRNRDGDGTATLLGYSSNRFGGESPYLNTCLLKDGSPALPGISSKANCVLGSNEPYVVDAQGSIPDVLACSGDFAAQSDCVSIMQDEAGTVFTSSDVAFSTDTSYDGMITNLFTQRVAYDILDENNPEESALKALIRQNMRKWAEHNIANGYMMVDAQGQPNRWSDISRLKLSNDPWTFEDRNEYATFLMAGMKLTAYVTGEKRFEDEYQSLALSDFYHYADLAQTRWSAYEHLLTTYCEQGAAECDQDLKNDPAYISEWVREYNNLGDASHMAQAYYILFTLEPQGTPLHKKWVSAYDSQWELGPKYEDNAFHSYVRQLGQPDTTLNDGYGNEINSANAWNLSRHPLDLTQWGAYDNSRPDVARTCVNDELSNCPILKSQDGTATNLDAMDLDKYTNLPLDEKSLRTPYRPMREIDKDESPNQMVSPGYYTLPYWIGRYHNFIAKPTKEAADMNRILQ